jgi:hypothetical protein
MHHTLGLGHIKREPADSQAGRHQVVHQQVLLMLLLLLLLSAKSTSRSNTHCCGSNTQDR